jgi:hypothetical protein
VDGFGVGVVSGRKRQAISELTRFWMFDAGNETGYAGRGDELDWTNQLLSCSNGGNGGQAVIQRTTPTAKPEKSD